MKLPASGTRGRICPKVSLNLQEICQTAEKSSLLFVSFVHQNWRVAYLIQFDVMRNKNHPGLMFRPSELAGDSSHTV